MLSYKRLRLLGVLTVGSKGTMLFIAATTHANATITRDIVVATHAIVASMWAI